MHRILVAYDGGAPARRALDTAIDLAKLFDAKVTVVSVIPFHPTVVPIDPWDDRVIHEGELAEAKAILEAHGISAELIEPVGAPGPTIERIALDGGFDTIVVGSRGLGALSRLFQGSVSGHVATHARATVVVAH